MDREDLLLFGVLYDGEVCSENCPLLLLMGKNLFSFLAFRKLLFINVDSGQKREASEKKASLAKAVAGTRHGSRERRPEYHCFHKQGENNPSRLQLLRV
jgi:hypothetical protein